LSRHARVCSGICDERLPRSRLDRGQNTDGRGKPGHHETMRYRSIAFAESRLLLSGAML
jgi:hypothetical protein